MTLIGMLHEIINLVYIIVGDVIIILFIHSDSKLKVHKDYTELLTCQLRMVCV